MTQIRSYRDLKVWQLGIDISKQIYKLTSEFPRQEIYGITAQIRRAVTSIPANIAEGHGRDSTKEYLRHLSIAMGPLAECETFLHLAVELNYLSQSEAKRVFALFDEEGRMIRGLQKSLRSRLKPSA